MKISKKDRRCIAEATLEIHSQINSLYEKGYLSPANLTRLDVIRVMLERIRARLEDKHGKR